MLKLSPWTWQLLLQNPCNQNNLSLSAYKYEFDQKMNAIPKEKDLLDSGVEY